MFPLADGARLTIKEPVAAANSEAGHAIMWAIIRAQAPALLVAQEGAPHGSL